MIELNVKLARAESPIYVTGEKVECFIEFTNYTAIDGGEEAKYVYESLAWASVQLHCYRKTSYHVGPNKPTDLGDMIGKTTLDAVTQAPGHIIIATKPKILFCDLKLLPGEKKTYFFSEFVPRGGPPTYRGHDIKYFYKITIATQRLKSKVQTLAVPIRILPLPQLTRTEELPGTEETLAELTPTNPFLEKRELTELEISWHHLKNLTAQRAPKIYRISNKHGFVGRFCLFKPCYKLGEDIVGSLDFTNRQVRCVQFSVKLQKQEIPLDKSTAEIADFNDSSSVHSVDLSSLASGTVPERMNPGLNTIMPEAVKRSAIAATDEAAAKITTYAKSHQVCYATVQTQVVVPIPLQVTPTFSTELVDVRWRMHFEFVTSTMLDFGLPNKATGEVQAPSEIPVETMIWNLPITIYTANPLQIYSPSQVHSLLIK